MTYYSEFAYLWKWSFKYSNWPKKYWFKILMNDIQNCMYLSNLSEELSIPWLPSSFSYLWGRGLINHYYHHFNIIFNISRCLNVMMSNSDYLFNPPLFQVQPLDSQISLHIHNKTNDGHNTHIQTEAFFSHMYNTLWP